MNLAQCERVGRAPVPKYSAASVEDRCGRTLAEVVEQQHRAVAIVERLDEIVAAIEGEEVLLVRAAGPRLIRRLQVSANALDKIARRVGAENSADGVCVVAV
jgi:hypothetical protein